MPNKEFPDDTSANFLSFRTVDIKICILTIETATFNKMKVEVESNQDQCHKQNKCQA